MDANLRPTRSRVFVSALIGIGLTTGGFLAGWHLSRRPIGLGSPVHYLGDKGDAREPVRAAVLVSLKVVPVGLYEKGPRDYFRIHGAALSERSGHPGVGYGLGRVD